ncbi:MAG: four helix bundle protein [Candidatus Daviesbacteria bacterium]|nr:four helix bundle protein [Candidatus Daviesbacteria bacterium]
MNDQQKAIQEAIDKTMRELSEAQSPVQRSRTWTDPEGYKYLVSWSNSVLLRFFIRLFTVSLPKSEYRRKAQLDDAARSVVRNQEEGYKRSTTKEYFDFLGFSQGSLEEVKGDIRELTEDKFLQSKPRSSLISIGINLKDFHEALKPKGRLEEDKGKLQEEKGDLKENRGKLEDDKESFNHPVNSSIHPVNSSNNPVNSSNNPLKDSKGDLKENRGTLEDSIHPVNSSIHPVNSSNFDYQPLTTLYPPLAKIKAEDLSYEIFLELINKTDYNLRLLVQSLEKKSNNDKKGYLVEQARIKDKFRSKSI